MSWNIKTPGDYINGPLTVAGVTQFNSNVGIGVTPSAWSTFKGLQVGYASLAGYAGTDTFLGSNVYYDGGFKYIGAGLASSYRQLAGSHEWKTAVSGVNPGDPVALVTLATLNASGDFSPVGNVVMANTKGIDFSATAGTGTSELLDDYEQGTWSPTVGTNVNLTSVTAYTASYTKVGRLVTITGSVTATVTLPNIVTYFTLLTLPFANNGTTTGAIQENGNLTIGAVQVASSNLYGFFTAASAVVSGAATFNYNVTYSV